MSQGRQQRRVLMQPQFKVRLHVIRHLGRDRFNLSVFQPIHVPNICEWCVTCFLEAPVTTELSRAFLAPSSRMIADFPAHNFRPSDRSARSCFMCVYFVLFLLCIQGGPGDRSSAIGIFSRDPSRKLASCPGERRCCHAKRSPTELALFSDQTCA